MQKRTKVAFWIAIIILLGFLRGYLFGNIKWVELTLTENRPVAARQEFHFLLEWPIGQLILLKWILTLIFFGLFGLLTWWIIKLMFGRAEYAKISILVFAGIFSISAILYVIYTLMSSPLELYYIIRSLMGLGQSFIPLMLLALAFKFVPQGSKMDN